MIYDENKKDPWTTGCPKKRTFRTEAASSTALAPVREAAHLLGDRWAASLTWARAALEAVSVLKVHFFGTPCTMNTNQKPWKIITSHRKKRPHKFDHRSSLDLDLQVFLCVCFEDLLHGVQARIHRARRWHLCFEIISIYSKSLQRWNLG